MSGPPPLAYLTDAATLITPRAPLEDVRRAVRVAATGDLHFRPELAGQLLPQLERARQAADLLLVAGDLTEQGDLAEAAVVARELGAAGLPVVAVLGNHDHNLGLERELVALMQHHGVRILQGEGVVLETGAGRVGVAGVTGFGGGFPGACAAEFGEGPMKDFVGYARYQAFQLEAGLRGLDADVRIALLHYSPCRETLKGETLELYPFLGSHLLGEAIDRAGADLVLHGHAHFGQEEGTTDAGIPVRNVALPVTGHTFRIFLLPVVNPEPEAGQEAGDTPALPRLMRRFWPRRGFRAVLRSQVPSDASQPAGPA